MVQENRRMPVSVYYHTHWDREWYLPFRLYQVRLAEVIDEILDRLEKGVFPCFMLDGQTVVLDDYLALRPENRERIGRWIRSGKLSIGPWYVMPDEFLVGGESLIRNLLRGLQDSSTWGCQQFTGYLPDTFGHSADMPTLLRNCGLNSAVVWRGIHPSQSVFQWKSTNGDAVTALHLTDGYFQMMLHDWTATDAEQIKALQALVEKLEAAKQSEVPILISIGGDHLAPVTEKGHRLLSELFPDRVETTPDAYMSGLKNLRDLPIYTGELIDNTDSFLLPGVYSSRLYLKQANRRLEHQLTRQVEPLMAMAQALLPEQKSPRYLISELKLAWELLMLNHPHDSICGCSVDPVHRENEVRFDQVEQLTQALIARNRRSLLESFGSAEDWVIINTGNRPFTGVVTQVIENSFTSHVSSFLSQILHKEEVLQDEYLADPHRIPLSHLTEYRRFGAIWVEDVPPLGIKTVSKSKTLTDSRFVPVQVTSRSLKNELLALSVSAEGMIRVQIPGSDQCYENLLHFQDQADQGDSYNSAPTPGTTPEIAQFIHCQVLHNGPLIGKLELKHQLQSSRMMLSTEVELHAGCPLLRFQTTLTNTRENHKLQAVFSTGEPIHQVLAESHLGVVHRHHDPAYREADAMPADKMKELKTNSGPIQRFISANGQSWITEGLTEYEVYQDALRLTLLRAFGALSSASTGVRGAQAGPPYATPEGQCLNRTIVCRYSWLTTPLEPAQLYELAGAFYGTVSAQAGMGEPGELTESPISLVRWDQTALVASACYWLPGRGLILRLLNTATESITSVLQAGFSYQRLLEVDFLEQPVEPGTSPAGKTKTAEQQLITIDALDVKTWLFEV